MVMVVSDPALVPGRRADGLDTPDEASIDEHAERIVDGLARDGPDLGPRHLGHAVRRDVGSPGHRTKHGQALCRNREAVLAKQVSGFDGHGRQDTSSFGLGQDLDRVHKTRRVRRILFVLPLVNAITRLAEAHDGKQSGSVDAGRIEQRLARLEETLERLVEERESDRRLRAGASDVQPVVNGEVRLPNG
jgi:hypothetical protein